MVRGIRGAVQVEADTKEAILEATAGLLQEMRERNGLVADEIVSVLFTATQDLVSAFPAEAIRRVGLRMVPALCARELAVDGAMPRVVRVLMHVDRDTSDVVHVYQGETLRLRDDLP